MIFFFVKFIVENHATHLLIFCMLHMLHTYSHHLIEINNIFFIITKKNNFFSNQYSLFLLQNLKTLHEIRPYNHIVPLHFLRDLFRRLEQTYGISFPFTVKTRKRKYHVMVSGKITLRAGPRICKFYRGIINYTVYVLKKKKKIIIIFIDWSNVTK
jgi:hypothetical protein